jgi:protein gp37
MNYRGIPDLSYWRITMGKSKIEWTEKTWNPTTGCNKVSAGCKFCYAEVMHRRLMKMQPEKYNRPFLDGAFPHEPSLEIPLKWKKPQRIFVNSMSDLFHKDVPFEFINKVFGIMALCEQHTFQILTKRPERALEFFNKYLPPIWKEMVHGRDDSIDANIHYKAIDCNVLYKYKGEESEPQEFPLPNVWLGVSCEDQKTADERIPILLQIPAAVKWISAEPLLSQIDLMNYLERPTGWIVGKSPDSGKPIYSSYDFPINWVVAGGESGHGARPMHPDWIRKIRDDCKAAGVPFLFKQWGEFLPECQITDVKTPKKGKSREPKLVKANEYYFFKVGKKKSGRLLDGVLHDEYPKTRG